MSSADPPAAKSNALLTPSERESKRRLKAEAKFQRRVKKLETRIKHAISRSDPVVEQSTRKELEALLSTRDGGIANGDQLQLNQHCPSKDARGQAAINIVLDIHRRLLASSIMDDDEKEKIRDEKIQQTKKARHLLRNMTKGTQSKSMFRDTTALRGYARQKFHGRASLIVESLGKLSPEYLQEATSKQTNMEDGQQRQWTQQREIMSMCWEKLGRIEKVCSLGCGPGNDAVGLTAFLRSYFDCKDGIKEMCLLDFAMDEWKSAVLDDLVPLLVPESAKKMTCNHCDVTGPLSDECIVQIAKEADIFLTSYLLTETRDQWHGFFAQLAGLAKRGALFYFAEPVPWQLHQLIRMSTEGAASDANVVDDLSPLQRLKFAWIDCSMIYPDMQKLDRRSGGPAVLLAIKV